METFDVGRTVSRATRLVTGTLPSAGAFLALAVVVSVGLNAVSSFVDTPGGAGTGNLDKFGAIAAMGAGAIASLVAATFVAALTFSGSLYGLLQFAQQRPVTLGECIRVGIAKMLPVLGVMVLWYIAVIAGIMLFVAPGIVAITVWSAPLPVLINENTSIRASFRRSRELTKGSRGKIFLLLLLAAIFTYLVATVILGVVAGADLSGLAGALKSKPWLYAVQIVLSWVTTSAINALLVSIYLETLAIKGGGPPGHLDQVFA